MRPAAHFLSLATLTALLVSVLEVAVTAAQKPGFLGEPRLLKTTRENPEKQLVLEVMPMDSGRKSILEQAQQADEDTTILLQVEGVLELGDSIFSEDNSLYDTYTFEAEAGQAVIITLESTEFDTYLLLRNGQGESINQNDDISRDNRNSQIAVVIPETGTYQVLASAYDETQKGAYRLTVNQTHPDNPAIRRSEAEEFMRHGDQLSDAGQDIEAIEIYEQALAIYQHLNDHQGEMKVLGSLSIAYTGLGQNEKVIAISEERLNIAREANNRSEEFLALGILGNAYSRLEQYEQALDFHQQSLAIIRELQYRANEGLTLQSIGDVYLSQEKYKEAIRFYQQSLAIARELENRGYEVSVLQSLGKVYLSQEQYQQAISTYQESLEIARESGDQVTEERALGALSFWHQRLGNYKQAIDFGQQQLEINLIRNDIRGVAIALSHIGAPFITLSRYDIGIDYYQQALEIARELEDSSLESGFLYTLGVIHRLLGQYESSIEFHEQALSIAREDKNRASEGINIQALGAVYYYQGRYQRSIEFTEKALEIAQEIGNTSLESYALVSLGFNYNALGSYKVAIYFYERTLSLTRKIDERRLESIVRGKLGEAYKNLGQYTLALEEYRQALSISREIGYRDGEGLWLNNIGYLLADQSQPELAIIFLKASVEARESIRGNIRNLEFELQQAYTDTVANDYRFLADLLLQQNRIIEAQRVLDLLKVQELDDYLDDVQRNAQTETGVDFWQPEEEVLALYDDVLLTGTELQRLQALDTLTPDQQARLAELEAQQNRLYASFIDWLDHPQIIAAVDQLRTETRATVDIDNFTDLQASLRQLPQTSVILYPLVLEERLELVLVSADAPPVRYPIDVDATTLNRTVVEFGQALKDRRSDPRPSAQRLYDWVIAPLEAELAAVGAENIIFAPDGVLRYVPLAALYDGDKWLIERFTFNQITAASETDFAAAPRDGGSRSLLAAACADCTFSVNVGDDTFSFGDLPATRQEVETLVAQIPEAEVLIDGDFTPEQFQSLLSQHPLIHLATHGQFVSGAPEESFVLFGNGNTVNLRQMRRDWQQMDADLVVLSACETALGSAELGDGVEVLGLGFQLQQVGAKAVLASLWQVSDQGTQVLMTEFYNALNQGMTKAAALQAAQQALITGESEIDNEAIRAGAPPLSRDGAPATSNYPGYSHPYYWAPFILIGNGL